MDSRASFKLTNEERQKNQAAPENLNIVDGQNYELPSHNVGAVSKRGPTPKLTFRGHF
jgi:hypothetical protein